MGLITRYELVEILPIGDWISIIAFLETSFVQNPDDLASLLRLGAMAICDTFFHRGEILILWKACKRWCETSKQQLGPLQPRAESTNMVAESPMGENNRGNLHLLIIPRI